MRRRFLVELITQIELYPQRPMKKTLLILVGLAVLSVRLNAKVPDAWTQEKLKKLYGGEVTIASSNGHIKSVAFVKRNPESFHGGNVLS